MISMLQPLPIGNAIRIFLTPLNEAKYWRVLRKGSDSFTGYNDTDAILVHEGDDKTILDSLSLLNNVMAFYRAYYFVDNTNFSI